MVAFEYCSLEIGLGDINILPTSILEINMIFSLLYIRDIPEITEEIIYLMILHVVLQPKSNKMVMSSLPIMMILILFTFLFNLFSLAFQ